MFSPKQITRSLLVAASIGFATTGHAAAILYWEADGNAANSGSSGITLNGTLGTNAGGALPTYSATVPGAIITAGVGGAIVNASNTNSFSFVNSGLPSATNSPSGGVVNVSSASFQVTTFTAEAFVKTSSLAGYSTIFNLSNSLGAAWMLDTNGVTGQLRLRVDTATTANQERGNTLSPVITDDVWHHVAVTYNGTSFTVFLDYVAVITGFDPAGDVLYDGSSTFNVGAVTGRAYNGLIDEVRFSNTVLSTNDFLRAIPEPSAALLGAISLLGFVKRKRN